MQEERIFDGWKPVHRLLTFSGLIFSCHDIFYYIDTHYLYGGKDCIDTKMATGPKLGHLYTSIYHVDKNIDTLTKIKTMLIQYSMLQEILVKLLIL